MLLLLTFGLVFYFIITLVDMPFRVPAGLTKSLHFFLRSGIFTVVVWYAGYTLYEISISDLSEFLFLFKLPFLSILSLSLAALLTTFVLDAYDFNKFSFSFAGVSFLSFVS